MSNSVFIRSIPLPHAVRAVTLPNTDGTFDIYVNASLAEELQIAAIEHEMTHIRKDHFYDPNPVWFNEQEAG